MDSHTLSKIVHGRVMHSRLNPVGHRFVYPVFFLLLDVNELMQNDSILFGVNRRAPIAFNFSDHGDGRHPREWIRDQLAQHGQPDCRGRILVQSFPRVLGYLFNPVSFWYCFSPTGDVTHIIVEVNNTFGERTCYVLSPDQKTGNYHSIKKDKALYVSPFFPVDGHYQFYFNTDFDRPSATIDYYLDDQLQLKTRVSGKSHDFSKRNLLTALLRQPFLTFSIIVKIHWQALLLWLKKVPLCSRKHTPLKEISR